MSNLASQSIVIPAGVGQILPVVASGSYFYCLAASQGFWLSVDDNGSQFQMLGGIGFEWAGGFSRLVFRNQTNSAITVTFYAGNGVKLFQEDSPQIVGDTILVCLGETVLAAGVFFPTVLGTPLNVPAPFTPVSGHLKQIIITNLHATDRVQVCNGAGSVFDSVLAGQTKAYETSAWAATLGGAAYLAGVRLFVPGANAITVDVGMIYWA